MNTLQVEGRSFDYSNQGLLDFYKTAKQTEQHTLAFAHHFGTGIAKIAGYLALRATGLTNDRHSPFFLSAISSINSAATPFYDQAGLPKHDVENRAKLERVIKKLPSQVNKEILPLIMSEYDDSFLDRTHTIELVNDLPFNNILSMILEVANLPKKSIESAKATSTTDTINLITSFLNKNNYDPDSIKRYEELLTHHLSFNEKKDPQTRLLTIISSRLANTTWLAAKLHDHNLRKAIGNNSDPLAKSQFDTFDNMIKSAYKEYIEGGYSETESLLLVGFKIFQDIAEFH